MLLRNPKSYFYRFCPVIVLVTILTSCDLDNFRRYLNHKDDVEEPVGEKRNFDHFKHTTSIEGAAEFPGGMEGLKAFLQKNIRYPDVALEEGVDGKVYAKFVISKTGEVRNVTILRSLTPECDHEVIRVLQAMPKWKPAEEKGKPVNSYYTLPVSFRVI